MRIAAGARLVSRVAFDPTLGRTPDERLSAQVNAANTVLAKIACSCATAILPLLLRVGSRKRQPRGIHADMPKHSLRKSLHRMAKNRPAAFDTGWTASSRALDGPYDTIRSDICAFVE